MQTLLLPLKRLIHNVDHPSIPCLEIALAVGGKGVDCIPPNPVQEVTVQHRDRIGQIGLGDQMANQFWGNEVTNKVSIGK